MRDIPLKSNSSNIKRGSNPYAVYNIAIDKAFSNIIRRIIMATRIEYETKLRDYPDVVTVKDLMIIFGGVCERTVISLLQKNKITHFCIKNKYHIPKVCVIDFMMSDRYAVFKKNVEAAHFQKIQDKEERGKQKILFLCETPQTRKNLMFLLDVKSKKTFFRLYLKPLLETGELRMTHPEQPSISTQRYIRNTPSRGKHVLFKQNSKRSPLINIFKLPVRIKCISICPYQS